METQRALQCLCHRLRNAAVVPLTDDGSWDTDVVDYTFFESMEFVRFGFTMMTLFNFVFDAIKINDGKDAKGV